jgi:hypothetical protein
MKKLNFLGNIELQNLFNEFSPISDFFSKVQRMSVFFGGFWLLNLGGKKIKFDSFYIWFQ